MQPMFEQKSLKAGGRAGIVIKKKFGVSPKSWTVDARSLEPNTVDLSVKNPNRDDEVKHRSPKDILEEIPALDHEAAEVLQNIKRML